MWTKEEIAEALRLVNIGYNWVACDLDKKVFAFVNKPKYRPGDGEWYSTKNDWYLVDKPYFKGLFGETNDPKSLHDIIVSKAEVKISKLKANLYKIHCDCGDFEIISKSDKEVKFCPYCGKGLF